MIETIADSFQHPTVAKNQRIEALKSIRTLLLYLCHHSPKAAQLRAKRDCLCMWFLPQGQMRAKWASASPALWDAAQEAHLRLSTPRIFKGLGQLNNLGQLKTKKRGGSSQKSVNRSEQVVCLINWIVDSNESHAQKPGKTPNFRPYSD